MSDDDWTRMARRMSEISEAPLFIDDSPNLTLMEIRAKARRLKQRNDLKLIILDYLQLMTSGRKVESRQQEVSEFSRQIKLLAKELEVPVVAISQLNRGPEQRTDKRPMLSDLRESGCLTGSTRLLRADTGAEVTFGELLASGEPGVQLWSFDERMRMVPREMSAVFPSGTKEVFRLRLRSGREVEATANHRFLTMDGWCPLADLVVGDRLATPRRTPPPLQPVPMPEERVVLLAHLIGDSSSVRRQPLRYASGDEANLQAVTAAAASFGITAVRDEYPAARCVSLRLPAPHRLTHGRRNPVAAWLDELGLFGLRSHEKFVPAPVFALPDGQLALFLRHLWATGGAVSWDERNGTGRIYYSSTGRRLVDDVSRLLLRFGILTRLERVRKTGYRDGWHLHVTGAEHQHAFAQFVGVYGARGEAVVRVAERLASIAANTDVDTVPKQVRTQVRTLLSAQELTHREFSAGMGVALLRFDHVEALTEPVAPGPGRRGAARRRSGDAGHERRLLGRGRGDREPRRAARVRRDGARNPQLRRRRARGPQLDRAGRRHGHPAAPPRRVRARRPPRGRGRPDPGQAPQRTHQHHHGGPPAALQPVRGPGPRLSPRRP
jgi:replicative DNA helicase